MCTCQLPSAYRTLSPITFFLLIVELMSPSPSLLLRRDHMIIDIRPAAQRWSSRTASRRAVISRPDARPSLCQRGTSAFHLAARHPQFGPESTLGLADGDDRPPLLMALKRAACRAAAAQALHTCACAAAHDSLADTARLLQQPIFPAQPGTVTPYTHHVFVRASFDEETGRTQPPACPLWPAVVERCVAPF